MTPLSGTAWVGEMDDRIYHADPCDRPSLSSSLAGTIVNSSLAHAKLRHPKFGGDPGVSTTAMGLGDILHSLLLTGEDSQRLAIIGELNPKTNEAYADFKTKRAKELRDDAIEAGKTPMLPHKAREARWMFRHIYEAMCAKGVGLVGVGQAEQVFIWEEVAENGHVVQCRAKMDNVDFAEQGWMPPQYIVGAELPAVTEGSITELKTCATAKPSECERAIVSSGYDIQCAAYISAIEHLHPELAGKVPFRWVFVEKEPPWCVTVMHPTESILEVGRIKWRHAVNRFGYALENDHWPDYTGTEPAWAFASPWAMQQAEELGAA